MKERYLLEDGSDNGFSLITDYDGNDEQAFDVNVKSGEILPVLPENVRKRNDAYWSIPADHSGP